MHAEDAKAAGVKVIRPFSGGGLFDSYINFLGFMVSAPSTGSCTSWCTPRTPRPPA